MKTQEKKIQLDHQILHIRPRMTGKTTDILKDFHEYEGEKLFISWGHRRRDELCKMGLIEKNQIIIGSPDIHMINHMRNKRIFIDDYLLWFHKFLCGEWKDKVFDSFDTLHRIHKCDITAYSTPFKRYTPKQIRILHLMSTLSLDERILLSELNIEKTMDADKLVFESYNLLFSKNCKLVEWNSPCINMIERAMLMSHHESVYTELCGRWKK